MFAVRLCIVSGWESVVGALTEANQEFREVSAEAEAGQGRAEPGGVHESLVRGGCAHGRSTHAHTNTRADARGHMHTHTAIMSD